MKGRKGGVTFINCGERIIMHGLKGKLVEGGEPYKYRRKSGRLQKRYTEFLKGWSDRPGCFISCEKKVLLGGVSSARGEWISIAKWELPQGNYLKDPPKTTRYLVRKGEMGWISRRTSDAL